MAGTEKDFKVKKGLIVSEGITLGGHTFDDIDITSEASDADDHLMTALAIKNRIEDYGYSTTAGTVTSVTAGTGMTQSGTSTVNPTLNVIGGTGITANANDIAVTAAQTGITSVLNTGLVIGRDSTDQIKFSTDNQIIFRVGNADGVTFKASGEIEATKFDGALEGNADTASVANRVVVVANDAAGSFVNENNLILFSPDGAASNDGGNLTPESSTDFYYNPSTTILTVPKITSAFTGNVDGTATNATTITLGGHLINDVDIGTEFVDTDDHIMSSGAIKEKIESYSYTTNTGDVTLTGTQTLTNKIIRADDGTDSAPSLSFDADTDTGFYRPADNQIAVVANGARQLLFKDGSVEPYLDSDVNFGTSSFRFKNGYWDLIDTLNFKVNGGQGSDGQVLTSTGSGVAWEDAAGGGASVLGDLTDVTMDITNFVDGILIQPNSDGSAPTTGTLNGATENIGIGKDVLKALTSGDYNVVIGPDAGEAITSGGYNVLIGRETGQGLTTASNVVAIGDNAGRFNTGSNNTFVGVNAGKRGTSGATNNNTFVGNSVGLNNTGGNNTVMGHQALIYGAGGANNVVMGYLAAQDLTSDNNVAIGSSAALNVTSGTRVIAIGTNSMDAATTESDNIAIGYDALGGSVNGGEQNVVIGNYAGDALTTADGSTLVGHKAGTALTTGWGTTLIGFEAGAESTGSRNTFMGYRAGHYYTSGNDNIALGYQALHGSFGNSAGSNNISIGKSSSFNITTGGSNIAIGDNAGNNITTGSNNVVIGEADVPSATGNSQLSISDGVGGVTWIQGNADGIVLGALTPLFFERSALDTTAVDFRVPTVQSSTANPNSYPMPFAGKVLAASFLFTGGTVSGTATNTIRVRKNGGSTGTDIEEFTFVPGDLNNPAGTNYTLVKTGLSFAFSAGDILQVRRQSGSTDLNNAQALLWVSYNF